MNISKRPTFFFNKMENYWQMRNASLVKAANKYF